MSKFSDAIKNARATKSLDKVLQGSGSNYLPEGTHDVSISAVDSSQIDTGKLTVIYADAAGKQFKDMMFLMDSRNPDEFSIGVRRLWAALLQSTSALDAFFAEFEINPEAFNMFTGMKLRLTLAPGKGYVVNVNGQQKYQAFEDGVPQTEEFDTVQEARDAAEAKGLSRAYLRIKKAEATNGEANVAAFLSAVAERQKAASNGSVLSGNFAAGTKTPSFV
jgi:hypothetical protein